MKTAITCGGRSRPCARVHVALDHPHLRWQGDGYFDMNRGDAPLEHGFT